MGDEPMSLEDADTLVLAGLMRRLIREGHVWMGSWLGEDTLAVGSNRNGVGLGSAARAAVIRATI